MKERDLQKLIKDYIIEKGGYVENIHGGSIYQASGIPDLLVCYKGWFIGIEVKVGNNKPSPIQEVKLAQIKRAGGYAIVPYDLEAVKEVFEEIDKLGKP